MNAQTTRTSSASKMSADLRAKVAVLAHPTVKRMSQVNPDCELSIYPYPRYATEKVDYQVTFSAYIRNWEREGYDIRDIAIGCTNEGYHVVVERKPKHIYRTKQGATFKVRFVYSVCQDFTQEEEIGRASCRERVSIDV